MRIKKNKKTRQLCLIESAQPSCLIEYLSYLVFPRSVVEVLYSTFHGTTLTTLVEDTVLLGPRFSILFGGEYTRVCSTLKEMPIRNPLNLRDYIFLLHFHDCSPPYLITNFLPRTM